MYSGKKPLFLDYTHFDTNRHNYHLMFDVVWIYITLKIEHFIRSAIKGPFHNVQIKYQMLSIVQRFSGKMFSGHRQLRKVKVKLKNESQGSFCADFISSEILLQLFTYVLTYSRKQY